MHHAGKSYRDRSSPQSRACSLRNFKRARKPIDRKYLLARLTSPFSRADAFVEITFP